MYYNIAERVIPAPMMTSFREIADYAQTMQRGMNARAGIGIRALRAGYNKDREKGLIERACGAARYDDIRKSFEEDLVNFGQSVVTDTLHENAEFQYQAGLSPVIRRVANGGCCDWCAKLAGTYPYEEVRETGNDVYRRHRFCRCRVTYDPGDGRRQDVHTKRWEPYQPEQLAEKAERLDPRSAKHEGRGKDVTKLYLQEATPGRGNISYEDGFDIKERPDEVATAKLMHKLLGGNIVLKAEKNGVKNPDYEWMGALWDLKTTTTEKSANSAIRTGLRQIDHNPGGVILNYENRQFSMRELMKVIEKRMGWFPDKSTDIMIISKGKIVRVLRY